MADIIHPKKGGEAVIVGKHEMGTGKYEIVCFLNSYFKMFFLFTDTNFSQYTKYKYSIIIQTVLIFY